MGKAKEIHQIHSSIPGKHYFRALKGTEEIGCNFLYEVTFYSEEPDLDPEKVLGEEFCIEVTRESNSRFFHGVICDFLNVGKFGGYQVYRIELRPESWLLTQQYDCRIFQKKNVVAIIEEVLKNKSNLVTIQKKLSGKYQEREYCTQYRESSFDFVCRLMEQEGITFYFEHEKSKHTLVLTDANSRVPPIKGTAKINYRPPGEAMIGEEHISRWQRSHRLRSGQVALTDYDFENSKGDLLVKSVDKGKHKHNAFERYDYPGKYVKRNDGESYSKVILNELRTQHQLTTVFGNAIGLSAGYSFTLADHPMKKLNTGYLISQANINVESGELEQFGVAQNVFEVEMVVVDQKIKFNAPRRTEKPFVHGPQTGFVVGKKDGDINTDKHGRVKVQLHWDRLGKNDDQSSCWIRVSQGWAGPGWGMIHTPRVGNEVVVSFLEGDPDRPIVTGSLYNDANATPYPLPANKTRSGIVTRSDQGKKTQFNELRFEDKKDAEQVYFQAEKDFERLVKNNDKLTVGTKDADKGNQTIEILNDRSLTVKEGNMTTSVKKGNKTTTLDKGNLTTSVKKGDMKTTVKGKQTDSVTGACTIQSKKQITLKVGASKIVIKPSAITIDSPTIKINGTSIAISAKTKLDAKGLMVKVSGSAMTAVKGAIVKIN